MKGVSFMGTCREDICKCFDEAEKPASLNIFPPHDVFEMVFSIEVRQEFEEEGELSPPFEPLT